MKEKLDDLQVLKKYVAIAINKRLRIKEVPDYLPTGVTRESERESAASPAESERGKRARINYFVFFLEEQ